MSTHLHLVKTDVEGVLPSFLQFFHRIVAHSIKVLRKWEGPVWDHEATSVVRLLTREAMVEKIAYVLANPVAAGLVRHAREWPGAQVDVSAIGRGALGAKRPGGYLDPENPQWPEEAALSTYRLRSGRTRRRAFAVLWPPSSSDRKRWRIGRCSGEGFASWERSERAWFPPTSEPRASRPYGLAIRHSPWGASRAGRGEAPRRRCGRFARHTARRLSDGVPECAAQSSLGGRGGCACFTVPT